jgi:hypothetical protein
MAAPYRCWGEGANLRREKGVKDVKDRAYECKEDGL